MHSLPLALSWLGAAYILYSIIARIITSRRDAAKAERLGCKPPPTQPYKLPFAIDLLRETIQSDKEHRFVDLSQQRYQSMGDRTYQYHMLGNTGIMTCEPKNIQAILATQFHDFCLGEFRRGAFFPLLGNGIFTADAKPWEHSRTMLRPQFARDQVSDLELEENHVQAMMQALPVNSSGWTEEVDIQVLFFRLTLDSACEFLFGESVESQTLNLPENVSVVSEKVAQKDEKVFAIAFDKSQAWLAFRVRFFDKYWLASNQDFRKNVKEVHNFVDYFVNLALNKDAKDRELEKGSLKSKGRYVFLDALVAQTRDPIELRSQLLNILLAGRDTTASLLGWICFVLARRPDLYEKLRAAVVESFGSYRNSSELTYVSLKGCQYLQHVMQETLRLYPVVPVNSRRAVRDTTLPIGGGPDGNSKIFIKAGTQVDYSVHAMHRREALWGPDAAEFKPERWINRKPGWEYLPFNGGPRICLGQQFALTEAGYVIVRLLQRFDKMENRDPSPEIRHNLTLTDCSANGVKIRLHEALV